MLLTFSFCQVFFYFSISHRASCYIHVLYSSLIASVQLFTDISQPHLLIDRYSRGYYHFPLWLCIKPSIWRSFIEFPSSMRITIANDVAVTACVNGICIFCILSIDKRSTCISSFLNPIKCKRIVGESKKVQQHVWPLIKTRFNFIVF